MKEGRLFRSASATGAQAEAAEPALPRERLQRAASAQMRDSSSPESRLDTEAGASPGRDTPAALDTALDSAFDSAFDSALAEHTDEGQPQPATIDVAPADSSIDAFDHLFADDTADDTADDSSAENPSEAPAARTWAAAAEVPPVGGDVSSPIESPQVEGARDSHQAGVGADDGIVSGLAALRAGAEGTARGLSGGVKTSTGVRLRYRGAVAIILAVTVVTAATEELLAGGIGIGTCLASAATTLLCVLSLPRRDARAVCLALPAAWLVSALLPGQMEAPNAGGIMKEQVALLVQVLVTNNGPHGTNGWWILLGTIGAFAVAVLPRRSPADDAAD